MSLNTIKPAKGKLLISEPLLNESYFRRSVVLLTEHINSGSHGFILNKPVDLKLSEALPDFVNVDFPLYLGGPVQKDSIYYIHTLGNKLEGSTKIFNGLYYGGDFETMKTLIMNGKATQQQVKFFVGYSGWASRQLDQELQHNSWIVADGDLKIAMSDDNHNQTWSSVLRSMGAEFAILSNFPEDRSMN